MKTILLTTKPNIKHLILSALFLIASVTMWAQVDSCKVPMIPPVFSVTEEHSDVPQSFWQNGGHIPENTIDEDTTNYARAHIKATGSATLKVSDLDTTLTAGTFAGYYIKCRAFRDADFSGITMNTYLNGVLQETYSGDDLWVEYIPFYVNDPICIGFFTSTSWNEIEVIFSADGPRVHYDVFYAVTMGTCFPNEELPPGLPITWLSFEAQKKGEASDLKWITAQEFNNAGFFVERSSDGRHFELIGNVPAVTQPRDVNTYSFVDASPYRGLNYYRIRQVDHDGQTFYSPVKTLSFASSADVVKLWPNPVADQLNIAIPDDMSSGGDIKLINSNGVIVMTKTYSETEPETDLDLSSIQPGIYSLVIESAAQTFMQHIVVIK